MAASVERMVTAQGIDTRLVTEAEAKALHPLVETADANVFGWEPKYALLLLPPSPPPSLTPHLL